MTRYTGEDIAKMKQSIIGHKAVDLYHEPDGDYYVIEFEDPDGLVFETSFRFMADLPPVPPKTFAEIEAGKPMDISTSPDAALWVKLPAAEYHRLKHKAGEGAAYDQPTDLYTEKERLRGLLDQAREWVTKASIAARNDPDAAVHQTLRDIRDVFRDQADG